LNLINLFLKNLVLMLTKVQLCLLYPLRYSEKNISCLKKKFHFFFRLQAIDKIPVYRFKDDAKIRNSFSGGSVDLFKPTNLELSSNSIGAELKTKEKLWYYDFNSLFPSVLRNFDYPCGNVKPA
jgi:hypothetical protein